MLTSPADRAHSGETVPEYAGLGRQPALTVPRWLDRAASWSWRLLLVGGLLVALLWLLAIVRLAVVPAMIAMVLAASLWPVTRRLRALGLPPFAAAALPLLGGLTVIGFGLWLSGHQTASELLNAELEIEQVRTAVYAWLTAEPFNLDRQEIASAERAVEEAIVGGVKAWGSNHGRLAVSVFGSAVLGVVLTFFFLKDGPAMWAWAVRCVDPVRRAAVDRAGRAAAAAMAGYLRSVAITGLVDAVLIGLGLYVLGVPIVVPLMIVTAVAALFPIVGAVVAGVAAALVALVTSGPETALWVVGLTFLVQQLEGNVIMPLLVGRRVSLHPAAVLLSLAAGAAVAGLAGAFLAIPVVAGIVAAVPAFRSACWEQRTAGTGSEAGAGDEARRNEPGQVC